MKRIELTLEQKEEAKRRFVIKATSDVSFEKIMETLKTMAETVDIFPMRSNLFF